MAMLKALAAEPVSFDRIDLYERRDHVGGLWYHGGDKTNIRPLVPSTSPDSPQLYKDPAAYDNRYFSPMYNQLETNIPGKLMEFAQVHFPGAAPVFPHRDQVHAYLRAYAATIGPGGRVHTATDVVKAVKQADEWVVTVQSPGSDPHVERYDAMVVANGHFDVPYIPDVPGVGEWARLAAKTVSHAKYFGDGSAYAGKTVLIVGGYASGTDLAVQIGVSAAKVYLSTKEPEKVSPQLRKLATPIGVVSEYKYEPNRLVTTEDGETVEGIDAIVFCTGYLYSVPFLSQTMPELTDGAQIKNLYRQMVYIDDPSLTFLALPKFVIPMPLAEAQACVVARFYSGRLTLPPTEEMRRAYAAELELKGPGKAFHNLNFPEDVEYCTALGRWIDDLGLANEGLVPVVWDDDRIAARKATPETKAKRVAQTVAHALRLRERGEPFSLCPESESEPELRSNEEEKPSQTV